MSHQSPTSYLPMWGPTGVAGVSDVYPCVDRDVFTQEQCHAAWIVEVDIEIFRRLYQHALERDIQQVATPFLVTTLHEDLCGKRDAIIVAAF